MRRLFPFALGIGAGAAAAVMLARATRRARKRIPEAVAKDVKSLAASVRELVSDAVEEGRRAARETESQLKSGT